jgi:hypothetical protein
MTETKPTGGKLLGFKINWKIALAISIPLALAIVGSAVSKCGLSIGVTGIALTCKDSK